MASWQAIRLTKEATPGTFNAGATPADRALIRLTENSAFPTQPAPIYWTVRGAEGSNRPAQTGTAQFNTSGKITTLFYPSQAKLLMAWATTLGGTYPALIPQSVTIDHIQQTEDPGFTLRYRRFLGCYVQNMNLTSNNPGAASRAKLEFDILFLNYDDTITVTDFPVPAQADYPPDQPYGFQQAGAGFTLGTARTGFSMLNLSVKNILRAVYDESALPQVIRWCGRDVTLATNFRFKNLTDRAAFEAQTALACSVAFTDGTTTTTFDFQSQARINQFSRDQPLDNVPRTPLSVTGYLDPASNTDLTVTVTP